jgi:hypothetical protein
MAKHLLPVHGECHCGAISYVASVDAERVTICHCTDCQALTGSAYRVSVPVNVEDFRLLRGAPQIYFKTGESGDKRAQAFCGNCGSPMFTHAAEEYPKTYGLRVGNIREREALTPRKRIWCKSALGWSTNLHGMLEREQE